MSVAYNYLQIAADLARRQWPVGLPSWRHCDHEHCHRVAWLIETRSDGVYGYQCDLGHVHLSAPPEAPSR